MIELEIIIINEISQSQRNDTLNSTYRRYPEGQIPGDRK